VEPSKSPYGTANVFVPKKALPDGTYGGLRVTADMRAVISVTIGDAFPSEDIQTIFNWLAGKKWCSVVDLRDGCWNFELAKESRPYTAFKTLIGLVQYTRMTMGLKNASAFFQRFVNHVYDGLKGENLQAYLDDLAVVSDTPKQHVADVCEM
jgi:Reverse transcriptase (RNA-dependent DNA polymerase)